MNSTWPVTVTLGEVGAENATTLLESLAPLRLETLMAIGGRPVSRATHWFPADLVQGLTDRYEAMNR